MNVWRLMTHHCATEAAVAWSREQQRIAMGWGHIGDLRRYSCPEDVVYAVRDRYPELSTWGISGKQLWSFAHEMKLGEPVILSTGKSRPVVMVVTGEYEHCLSGQPPQSDDYFNQRRARETSIDPNSLWEMADSRPAPGWSQRWTLVKCAAPVEPAVLDRLARRG